MTITYITEHLDTKEKCITYLEEKRWQGIPTCPYCASKKSSPKSLRHTCLNCKKSYSVTVGTVFEGSNMSLTKWFIAIALNLSAKKGISSLQLARDIGVNKNTAWLTQMKLRAAMKEKRELFVHVRSIRCPRKKGVHVKEIIGSSSRLVFTENIPSLPEIRDVWRLLRRAIVGQFHRIDEYYLERYLDEIRYKFNRKESKNSCYEELLDRALCLNQIE